MKVYQVTVYKVSQMARAFVEARSRNVAIRHVEHAVREGKTEVTESDRPFIILADQGKSKRRRNRDTRKAAS